MIKIKEMYSHSKKNKRLAEDTKLKTKNKTEYIEFWLKTVNNELVNNIKEDIHSNIKAPIKGIVIKKISKFII